MFKVLKFLSIVLFFSLFFPVVSKSEGFITEIINNTDTFIRIKADVFSNSEVLVSNPVASKIERPTGITNLACVPPRSRHVVHNLKISSIDVDDFEKNVQTFYKKGMHFSIDKPTASFHNPSFFYEESKPFLILRQKGDLISIVSACGAIKNFSFLGEKLERSSKTVTDTTIGDYISDNFTYTIEINQLITPSLFKRRRCFYGYIQNSLEIVFRKNDIDSSAIKSQMRQMYPIAKLIKFDESKRPITGTIEFDKVATEFFMKKFCENLKTLGLKEVSTFSPSIENGNSSIDFVFYKKVTKNQIQMILDSANKLKIPQFNS